MSIEKPLLPSAFLRWIETDPDSGEDVLRLMSWRRTLTLQGSAFASFEQAVLPLLDGTRTINEICEASQDVFSAEEVAGAINTLAAQGIVVEGSGDIPQNVNDPRAPHLGWLAENSAHGRKSQRFIEASHIVIFGAGGSGAVAARSLMASGVGKLTIVDPSEVTTADPFFASSFSTSDIGRPKAEALASALLTAEQTTRINAISHRPSDERDIQEIVEGATLVLYTFDSGELSLAMMWNKACRSTLTPWIAASMEGRSLVLGPGFFHAPNSPCYMCWRTREIATAQNQQTRHSVESFLSQQNSDLSHQRDNLAAGVDVIGGILAAETLSWISGASQPSFDGRLMTMSLPGFQTQGHTVLRNPACPVCSGRLSDD